MILTKTKQWAKILISSINWKLLLGQIYSLLYDIWKQSLTF